MAKLPYEQRGDESGPAFAAFILYRDMGLERTQREVAKQCGKNPSLVSRWGAQYHWRQRCVTWDLEVDRRKRVGDLKGVEDMRRRQTRTALALQELGNRELAKMLAESKKRSKAGTLEQGLVMKILDLGSRLERVNRGEPGEIVQNTSSDRVDLSALTVDELKVMKRVRGKLRAQAETAEADEVDCD